MSSSPTRLRPATPVGLRPAVVLNGLRPAIVAGTVRTRATVVGLGPAVIVLRLLVSVVVVVRNGPFVVGNRGCRAKLTDVFVLELVEVLGPLVVTGAHLALVLGVVVRSSVDRVVRLAPSGVGVLAIALLGPGIVVVSAAAREPR